jgi:hypothetical protein
MVSSILPKNKETKINLRYHSTDRLIFLGGSFFGRIEDNQKVLSKSNDL